MSINVVQIRNLTVRVLDLMDKASSNHSVLYSSPKAVSLLMGTMAQETDMGAFIAQYPTGPGRGIGSMEPRTERDIWKHHIKRHHKQGMILSVSGVPGPSEFALESNLAYQIVMMRLHYFRVKKPLPNVYDIEAQGKYWDKFYNINDDVGTPDEFIESYRTFIYNKIKNKSKSVRNLFPMRGYFT